MPPDADQANAAFGAAVAALEQQFGAMFGTVRAQFRDQAARVHPDLSPAGYNLLTALVRSGPQHAQALATALDTDKSIISRIVRQLTDLKLVARQPDPSDGRAYFLVATPAAVAKVGAVQDGRRRQLREFLSGWDVSDIRQLTDLLQRLTRNR